MKNPRVVKDAFAQCEECKTWLRLPPAEEDGMNMRTIPLLQDLLSVKDRWICNTCWDKRDPYQHDEDKKMWARYEMVQTQQQRQRQRR